MPLAAPVTSTEQPRTSNKVVVFTRNLRLTFQ